MDLSQALPSESLKGLPSSQQQLGAFNAELAKGRPALAGAKAKSLALASEAASLRQKLIDTAARIQSLEREQSGLANRIAQLQAQDDALADGFARDRVSVTRLLAILERLQHDMPPALAVRPDDALAAARGAMLVGASLPPVYAQAANLARRIEKLKSTRTALVARRLDAARTAASLAVAHADLQTLSAQKDREAAGAASLYTDLNARLDTIAREAADYAALVTRVNALRRAEPGSEGNIVTVTAQKTGSIGVLTKASLLEPVAGSQVPGGPESDKNPGITYATLPGAQVIAPADGKVLFAGAYHKEGQVLILEITTGYDIVLSGLGRVTVRPGDQLLAGEPVGIMPKESEFDAGGLGAGPQTRLYFELRQNGKGLDPEPWLTSAMRKAKKT
ncbi:MAG TPA: peptidoglycan DD-metalloendopeptidase family protein [Rhizomicrobium sp.]|jgi:septal ring factor EnvC (AmiA/AmiB activator)|nr:peptidoglycan DD-metalloendopeptidase family protein [Rhizomicrobium sp.]